MKKSAVMMIVIAGAVLISGIYAQAAEETLVSKLVRELGVTEKQASGGAGALLKHAQSGLGEADFAKVTKRCPKSLPCSRPLRRVWVKGWAPVWARD